MFDPSLFASNTTNFDILANGKNAKLTYSIFATYYAIIQIVCYVIVGLSFIIFLFSLNFHKMIGVESIQTVQLIFILRNTMSEDNYILSFLNNL